MEKFVEAEEGLRSLRIRRAGAARVGVLRKERGSMKAIEREAQELPEDEDGAVLGRAT